MTSKTKKEKNLQSTRDRSLFLEHCLKHQKLYLSLLFLMMVGVIFLTNQGAEKVFFYGEESYAHLVAAEEINDNNFSFTTGGSYPLYLLTKILPVVYVNVIPPLLTIISLLSLGYILRKKEFSQEFIFFFLLLLILSPFFMTLTTTISTATIFFFLFLLTFALLIQSKRYWRYLAILSVAVIPLIDQFSGLITVLALLFYGFSLKKSERGVSWCSLGVVLLMLLGSTIWLNTSFIQGPFHEEHLARDLISDLGGKSGISFFVLILGVLGFLLAWPKKRIILAPLYLFLPLLIPAYIYNTEAISELSIIIIFFASEALLFLINYKWQLPTLRQFTFFLLLLGIFFSSLAFISRLSETGLSMQEQEVLAWMKENIPSGTIIASFPEDADYVSYFAQKTVFFTFHDQDKQKELDNTAIFKATYVDQLFPILVRNNISYIYLSTTAKEKLSADQGLLFLLKNERFKLLHSAGEVEIWGFEQR